MAKNGYIRMVFGYLKEVSKNTERHVGVFLIVLRGSGMFHGYLGFHSKEAFRRCCTLLGDRVIV